MSTFGNDEHKRMIRLIYLLQYLRDGGRAEHPLSIAADAHHVAVGETSLHQHPATSADHATAPVFQQIRVRE